MAARMKTARTQQNKVMSDINVKVNEVIKKLSAQEPRLKTTLSREIDVDNGATDIADQTVEIYRQKLREE